MAAHLKAIALVTEEASDGEGAVAVVHGEAVTLGVGGDTAEGASASLGLQHLIVFRYRLLISQVLPEFTAEVVGPLDVLALRTAGVGEVGGPVDFRVGPPTGVVLGIPARLTGVL